MGMSDLFKSIIGQGPTGPHYVTPVGNVYDQAYERLKDQMASQLTHGGGDHSHNIGGYPTHYPMPTWREEKRRLLCMRLHIPYGQEIPFEFIDFMQGDDCVYVMVAKTKKDKPMIIEDDTGLFPSDTLVTQLRMMIG